MVDWTEIGETVLCLVASVIVGGVIGIERGLNGRWADLRTHILVSMGATIFVIAGAFVAKDAPEEIGRVIQGIAAGVGFLGAGTILKLSDELEVKGLTTASSIWLAAALGTTVGLKMFTLAIAATLISVIVLVLLRPLDKWVSRGREES